MTHGRSVLLKSVAALAAGLTIVAAGAPQAEARIKWSNPVSWDGATLKARLGLPYFAKGGCGNWDSLAQISRSPKWLQNDTSFNAVGLNASITVGGVSGGVSGSASHKSLSLRNTRGQTTTYMAGNVCMNWSTIYLGMGVSGTAMYNGQVRSASVTV